MADRGILCQTQDGDKPGRARKVCFVTSYGDSATDASLVSQAIFAVSTRGIRAAWCLSRRAPLQVVNQIT
jgi:hypothetical protein